MMKKCNWIIYDEIVHFDCRSKIKYTKTSMINVFPNYQAFADWYSYVEDVPNKGNQYRSDKIMYYQSTKYSAVFEFKI